MDGDHEAFRVLTEPWIRELGAHCARILGDPHDADDAVQETLIQAWRKLDSYLSTGPLRAWLYTIATNTSLNLRKARRRHDVCDGPEAALERIGPGVEERFAARQDLELAFMSAVAGLPARQRAAIILREGLGWSALEIADLLGTTPAAVNSALQRARALLAPPADSQPPRLDDLHQALLAGYVAAWDETDIDGLASLARADAARTTLLERLEPVGGGWIAFPDPSGAAPTELAFRPAFMNS